MRRLGEMGEKVILITATDGSGGEIMPPAEKKYKKLGSVSAVRKEELAAAVKILGIHESQLLAFEDGHITNVQVWGDLTNTFVELIEKYKPEMVITFDHSGWYFHLDHIAVSLAATLAVQQSEHRPDLVFLNHYFVHNERWKYIFADQAPITHTVDISAQIEVKKQAFAAHISQNLKFPEEMLTKPEGKKELFQLAFSTPKGTKWLAKQKIFQAV